MATVAMAGAIGYIIGGKLYNAWKLQNAILFYSICVYIALAFLYFIKSSIIFWIMFPFYGIAYGLFFLHTFTH